MAKQTFLPKRWQHNKIKYNLHGIFKIEALAKDVAEDIAIRSHKKSLIRIDTLGEIAYYGVYNPAIPQKKERK
jgi:hypothetical protein